MRLFDVAGPARLQAYCHAPSDEPFDPGALVSASDHDRWNDRGEPTLYLAGDPGVALVELGRHYQADGSELRRTVWQVDIELQRVVDLREAPVRARFSLVPGTEWLHERRRCREVARTARTSGDADGLIVPSAGLADRPERWNLVVFADCLEEALERVIRDARPIGSVCVEPASADGDRAADGR